jgi:hypothetical protein
VLFVLTYWADRTPEAHAPFLFPTNLSETSCQAATLGDDSLQHSLGHCLRHRRDFSVSTDIVLLEQMGRDWLGQMCRRQRIGMDQRHHQHCVGRLDARPALIRGFPFATHLAQEAQRRRDVLRWYFVSHSTAVAFTQTYLLTNHGSVTVISILRLRSLVNFAASANPTWDQTDVINWSNIEINIGIICACLPSLRVILVRLFPKVLGTTKGASQPYYAYGSQSRGMKKGGSALVSGPGKSAVSTGGRDPNSITYTKTFEVRHADSDEQSLVQMEMDQFAPRKPKNQSSNTSVSSL